MVKTEPRKATYKEAAAQQQHPDFTGAPFPPSFELYQFLKDLLQIMLLEWSANPQ